ncbi:MAG: helix-turn-helix transcriptional regulator [Planctomycetota bacterium]|jgi:predicted DNA-binding transcriptional regulator AlpA
MIIESQKDRAVRAREAAHLLGISRSLFYLLAAKEKSFPQGVKLGKARVWLISDLFNWLSQKPKPKR